MGTRQITNYTAVTTPAKTDEYVCQQSGVTKKITGEQIIANINNMTAASALDGTEIMAVVQSGTAKKITTEELAEYIVGLA